VITYALATSVMTFPGARNCPGIEPLDATLATNHVAPAAFASELTAAFRAWSDVANVVFRPADPATADIVIGAESEPRGRAFTNVDYQGVLSAAGPRSIDRAVICLNPAEPWKIGFDGDLRVYDLRYTLEHEIGHAIGLDHPPGFAELMGFRYLERFRTPQPGDISGAVALYGTPQPAGPIVAAHAPGGGQPAAEQPSLAIGGPVAAAPVLPAKAGTR